jgi:hypothetical protein
MKQLIFILSLGLIVSCSSESVEILAEETVPSIVEIIPKTRLDPTHVYKQSDSLKRLKGIIPYWNWEDYYTGNYWEEPGKTRLSFPGFRVKIDGKFDTQRSNDTLSLFEDVGWYFEGRTWYISADNKSDQFEIELAVKQNINEQFDYTFYDDSTFDAEKWFANSYTHTEISAFYPVEDSAGHYRLPWVHADPTFFEAKYIQKYDLDTMSNYIDSDGGGNFASIRIKGRSCIYSTEYGLVKITRTTQAGLKSAHYFKIEYSYGC